MSQLCDLAAEFFASFIVELREVNLAYLWGVSNSTGIAMDCPSVRTLTSVILLIPSSSSYLARTLVVEG